MILQARALVTLLAAVACAECVLLRPRATVSPATTTTTTTGAIATTTPEPQPSMRGTSPSTTKDTTASTPEPHPLIGTSPTTTTTTTPDAIASTEQPHPPASTPEPHPPPLHGSCFATEAMTASNTLTLAGNESNARLLFWPPADAINVTLNLTVAQGIHYSFHVATAIPQLWHSIDIYQPNMVRNKSQLYLNTERRYINLGSSRVVQMHVTSRQPTHWCFCPRAHLCTLLSPLKDPHPAADASGERPDLLAALLVVVFLLIVTLLALVGVTIYKKNELFHIYAKPIDCMHHGRPPPPLPSPNKQRLPHVDRSKAAKPDEDEKVAAKTDQTDEPKYSKVGGDVDNAAPPLRPNTNPNRLSISTQQQKHESINSLYGLI